MLEYTQAGDGARLMVLVYHDDADREYAYGPKSKVGTFTDALMAEAKQKGWVVVSMKNDWKRIFAFENMNSTIRLLRSSRLSLEPSGRSC